MRVFKSDDTLTVQAVAGTYVVILGINLPEKACKKLMGFSVYRYDHEKKAGKFLEGQKRFETVDADLPPGSRYSTERHPVQDFQWSDYSASPGKTYSYTVAALRGKPGQLEKFAEVTVKVTTECPSKEDETFTHEVYFNRGVAASQEYARRFNNRPPDKVEDNKAFEWLSRGIYEALEKYINDCQKGKHSLRIAAYEFHYEPFLKLLKATIKRGVPIKIVYDARKKVPGDKNRQAVHDAGLEDFCTERTEGASYISHNKFIVKLENKKPVSVWTGGMNFSEGGIFGHSNVAHVVNDETVAKRYLQYWKVLADDPTVPDTKEKVESLTPLPPAALPKGITCVFSPRANLDVLNYYRDLAMDGKAGFCMTFAFGINKLFKDVYKTSQCTLRFALLEKKTRSYSKDKEAEKKKDEREVQLLRNMPQNIFSIGSIITQEKKTDNELDNWLLERLSGLNANVNYIHNKFMLVDPLSKDPIVIAGSANFSDASTKNNDENMLLIRGDKRVADIYLGEFMRLWKHHSYRESLSFKRAPNQPKNNFLRTDNWWEKFFEETDSATRRMYFSKVH